MGVQTYDIQHKSVPAFGSKPVPQRKAAFSIMEAIRRKQPNACILFVCDLLTSPWDLRSIFIICGD